MCGRSMPGWLRTDASGCVVTVSATALAPLDDELLIEANIVVPGELINTVQCAVALNLPSAAQDLLIFTTMALAARATWPRTGKTHNTR